MDQLLPSAHGEGGRAVPDLVGPHDPPPFTLVNPDGGRALLIVCDHATNAVPRRLADLGLTAAQREGHIAWDPGAAAVARLLAAALDAPAVLSGYSRLVVDCNRAPDDPTAMPLISDGVIVPGNRDLGDTARAARIGACHAPYHQAVGHRLDAMCARSPLVVLFSVHSFTPSMRDGAERPWDAGVLWTDDGRIPVPLMAALGAEPGLSIGDNEPYSAHDRFGFTIETHAEPRSLPNALLEIRQDHLAAEGGPRRWAALVARTLDPILRSLGI
jgi:predicted N-formylglutamate amidohydrolase